MRSLMIGLIPLIGAGLGWDAAVVSRHARSHAAPPHKETIAVALPRTSTFVVVPVFKAPLQQPEDSEMSRLQARNRRLEALVRVLRNRDLEKPH